MRYFFDISYDNNIPYFIRLKLDNNVLAIRLKDSKGLFLKITNLPNNEYVLERDNVKYEILQAGLKYAIIMSIDNSTEFIINRVPSELIFNVIKKIKKLEKNDKTENNNQLNTNNSDPVEYSITASNDPEHVGGNRKRRTTRKNRRAVRN